MKYTPYFLKFSKHHISFKHYHPSMLQKLNQKTSATRNKGQDLVKISMDSKAYMYILKCCLTGNLF